MKLAVFCTRTLALGFSWDYLRALIDYLNCCSSCCYPLPRQADQTSVRYLVHNVLERQDLVAEWRTYHGMPDCLLETRADHLQSSEKERAHRKPAGRLSWDEIRKLQWSITAPSKLKPVKLRGNSTKRIPFLYLGLCIWLLIEITNTYSRAIGKAIFKVKALPADVMFRLRSPSGSFSKCLKSLGYVHNESGKWSLCTDYRIR